MIGSEIVVTIGPASDTESIVKNLKSAGASSFRINLSHSTEDSVARLLKVFESAGVPASLDTQGSQLRTSSHTKQTYFERGQTVHFSFLGLPHHDANLTSFDLNHSEAYSQLVVGDLVRVDFEGLIFKVTAKVDNLISAVVVHPGTIKPNKAVDIVGKKISLKPFTDFDLSILSQCASAQIKTIYISFANKPSDINDLRDLLSEYSYPSDVQLVAKIETYEGLANLTEIMNLVDGVLIDRGDLSREISISKIPYAVDSVIKLSQATNTRCYVATNVLDTMISSSLPSRAEISDLHSLLHKGISGIVLAAEVAIGQNPVNCVHVVRHMQNICRMELQGVSELIPRQYLSSQLPSELQEWL